MRFLTFLLGTVFLVAPPAGAVTQDFMLQQERAAATAPIHVQVESTEDPLLPAEVRGSCWVRAVVRQVFRGAELTPAGTPLRFGAACTRPLRAGEVMPPIIVGNEITGGASDAYNRGRLLEVRLVPLEIGPPDTFAIAGLALNSIPALTSAPTVAAPASREPVQVRRQAGETATAPALFPARDVTVTFRTTARPGEEFRSTYLARSWLIRSESGRDPGNVTLVDSFALHAVQVLEGQRSWRRLPVRYDERNGMVGRLGYARFTRQGEDTVAGLRCTLWQVQDASTTDTACVTPDGVQLRRTGPAGTVEVTSVQYAPLDPTRFRVPEGYREAR